MFKVMAAFMNISTKKSKSAIAADLLLLIHFGTAPFDLSFSVDTGFDAGQRIEHIVVRFLQNCPGVPCGVGSEGRLNTHNSGSLSFLHHGKQRRVVIAGDGGCAVCVVFCNFQIQQNGIFRAGTGGIADKVA